MSITIDDFNLGAPRQLAFKAEGLNASDFRAQGCDTHYTDAALAQRRALRKDPRIVAWLEIYFDTFQSWGHDRDCDDTSVSRDELARSDVLEVQARFCKALFSPNDWHYKSALKAAEEDWDREVGRGGKTMRREAFYDSLFELVDM